ncbi:MAG: hypothetical protein Q8T04_06370 [Bacteroidota bacterium]|nr:hypothetical protein [Bacteroidota bacterium]
MSVIYKNPAVGLPFTPHSAVRKGDYKLIFDWYGRLNLYNLRKDISGKTNLATQMSDKNRELFAELINFLEKNVEKNTGHQQILIMIPKRKFGKFHSMIFTGYIGMGEIYFRESNGIHFRSSEHTLMVELLN